MGLAVADGGCCCCCWPPVLGCCPPDGACAISATPAKRAAAEPSNDLVKSRFEIIGYSLRFRDSGALNCRTRHASIQGAMRPNGSEVAFWRAAIDRARKRPAAIDFGIAEVACDHVESATARAICASSFPPRQGECSRKTPE